MHINFSCHAHALQGICSFMQIKEQKSKKMKKHKKDKRRSEKKKNKYDSDSDSHEDTGKDLDALLAAKYIKLKEKLCKTNIAKLRKIQNKSSDVDAAYRHKAAEGQEALSSHRKRKHQSHSSDEDKNEHQPARTYGLQVCNADFFFFRN